MTSRSESSETQKAWGGFKLLGWIALPLGVIIVLVVLFSHHGLYQSYRFRQERIRLEQENVRLAAENTRLARTIDRLQHDPVLIQDLIRQELNFVKRNEIIFQFPPEKPAAALDHSTLANPEGAAAAPVKTVSTKKVGKSKGVSSASDGTANKPAGQRRE
ncbi:MAG: FtsB family cell division protein [Thermodesulfobacteriota bacterium]